MLPCPKLLKLESGQGKEITFWIIDSVAKYNECSALNDAKKPSVEGFMIWKFII